jgi:EAL domain-containing protein (putative c-di-GMP-specific phosphodiesterase class I)
MASNTDDAAIVASTVQMAHWLGLRTVAEGVENEYTWTMLADIGCLVAQGWLTARAMPGDEVPGWLAQYAAHVSATPQPRVTGDPPPATAELARQRARA